MTDSVETIRCSNCKRDILSANFVIHDVHCQRYIYLCSKCQEPVNYNQRSEHDEANHVFVFCANCHTQIEKYLLNKHMKDDCSQRKIKCQICDIEIGACDVSEHEIYCGARTEKCPECGEFVMLKYKQLHLDSNHSFLKLSDETGPSPSWKNGRRTLGNFFPDLHSGRYINAPPHQKKRLGRSENGRCSAKGSPECVGEEEKTKALLTSPNEIQKYSSYKKSSDCAGTSCSQDYKRRIVGGESNYGGRSTTENSVPDKSEKSAGGGVNSIQGMNNDSNRARSKGKELLRRVSGSPTKRVQIWEPKPGNDITHKGNDTDEDSNLALSIQLSEELKGGIKLENDELIAQAIERNAAVLSDFSLFGSVNKSKVPSDKNLSRNVYTGKKQSNTASKSQLEYYGDDSSDEEFLYAKNTVKKEDEASLPCQFCDSMFPSYALMLHQKQCMSKGDLRVLGMDKYRKNRTVKSNKETTIACRICFRMIPLSQYESHQLNDQKVVRLERERTKLLKTHEIQERSAIPTSINWSAIIRFKIKKVLY